MEDSYGPQATIKRNFRGATILLIEDNPDHATLIQTVLKTCMPEVGLLVAASTDQALCQLNHLQNEHQAAPRLILLDLYIPRSEDGWQLLRVLKEPVSPFRLIPLTLLSQSDKPDDIRVSYDLGANSYIVKPTNFPEWLTYFESLRHYWWHTVTLPRR